MGPMCVQGIPKWAVGLPGPGTSVSSDEDCLLLNVLAPASANVESNLPVMVQIHGGGVL